MKHDAQVKQARKLLKYIDTGTTSLSNAVYRNDVSDYTCEQQAQRESERLFRSKPLLICLSSEIPNAGDYLTDDYSGVPIVVVRDERGVVNALVNVCRHRCARVAQGRGCKKGALACPYHAWTYEHSGALKSIPFKEGFSEIDKSEHGLRSLPILEQHGLVWVVPSPGESIDVDSQMGGFSEDLEAFELSNYHHYETRTLRANMNWKLVVDTFLETYHLDVLHRETIAPILHGNTATFDAMGPHLRMIGARKTIASLRDEPEANWNLIEHSAMVYVFFPNTVFIMQGDHLETWRVYPDGDTGRSKMHVSLYTPEPAVSESAKRYWDKNMNLLMATVQEEDFPLAQNIQRDFSSGTQASIVFGRNEPALSHFHRAIRDAVR